MLVDQDQRRVDASGEHDAFLVQRIESGQELLCVGLQSVLVACAAHLEHICKSRFAGSVVEDDAEGLLRKLLLLLVALVIIIIIVIVVTVSLRSARIIVNMM